MHKLQCPERGRIFDPPVHKRGGKGCVFTKPKIPKISEKTAEKHLLLKSNVRKTPRGVWGQRTCPQKVVVFYAFPYSGNKPCLALTQLNLHCCSTVYVFRHFFFMLNVYLAKYLVYNVKLMQYSQCTVIQCNACTMYMSSAFGFLCILVLILLVKTPMFS